MHLTKHQTQFWVGQQLHPHEPLYNLVAIFPIHGPVDPQHFQQAFQSLINSADALRTVIDQVDGVPQQQFLENLTFSLDYLDFSDATDPQAAFDGWKQDRDQTVFNFSERLFDAALTKVSDQQYIWYLNIHHIIADGWSLLTMFKRLSALYQQSVEDQLNQNLPNQNNVYPLYQDFVTNEQAYEGSTQFQEDHAYWEAKRAQSIEPIIFYGNSAKKQRFEVQKLNIPLGKERTKQLKALAATAPFKLKSPHVSAFNLMLGILSTYLHHISGNRRLSIGTPYLNRPSAEFRETVGLCMQVAPLHIEVLADDSFTSLVKRVQTESKETLQHHRYTIGNIDNNAYDVIFNYHNVNYPDFNDWPAGHKNTRSGDDDVALGIHLWTYNSDDYLLQFNFHVDIFDADQSRRAVQHFLRAFDACITNPDVLIAQADLLPPSEAQTLDTFNHTGKPYPAHLGIHELFEIQVSETPNAIAAIFGDEQLTYQELNIQANQIANYLQKQGIGADKLVGIYTNRSLDMLATVLGVLKAGGAYVPLDPDYPQERLAIMLADANISVLVTQQSLLAGLPDYAGATIVLDGKTQADIISERRENLGLNIQPSQLAYVIFTSGSTGKPKGVQISHQAAVNFLTSMRQQPGMSRNDILLAVTTLSFDIALLELLLPVIVGGRVEIVGRDIAADGAALTKKLNNSQATIMQATPATWRMLLDAGWAGHNRMKILCGGEAMPLDLAERLHDCCKSLWNMYGPTETTVWSSIKRIHKQPGEPSLAPITIGKPIANTQMHILDAQGHQTPIGVVGELYIGGDGLARGYLNQPDLTHEKFLEITGWGAGEQRLYKTGDLAYYLASGEIICLGRIDNQVKIRGFRIELGDIEATLESHPEIQTNAVVALDDANQEKRLVAYIVYQDNPVDVGELRQFLSKRIPAYMVPAQFVPMAALPLTPNGKVDRRALPAPEQTSIQQDTEISPARNPIEETLTHIWADVLNVPHVGIYDNFFHLGGHSLLATRVLSQIRETFDADLRLRTLFDGPTIADLAQAIKAQTQKQIDTSHHPIKPIPRDQVLPISFSQERLWFLDQFQENKTTNHIPVAYQITGKLNVEAFKLSLNDVVSRHESLRTTIKHIDGSPRQVIAPDLSISIPVIDLRHLSDVEQIEERHRLTDKQARKPFNIAFGPLIRVTLLQLADTNHVLLITLHHIISDAWSVNILLQELAEAYTARINDTSLTRPVSAIQPADYAVWQRNTLTRGIGEAQLDYWKQTLGGTLPTLELPTDHPRPAVQTFREGRETMMLPAELVTALAALGRGANATPYMVMLAAFKTLLARYAGQDDVIIGTPVAGRTHAEIEDVIGLFLNILVLRTDLSGNPTFRMLLDRVRQVTLGAYANQDIPFEHLLAELKPERDLSRTPLFQIFFNMINVGEPSFDLPNLQTERLPAPEIGSKFDITLYIKEVGQEFQLILLYNADLFVPARMAEMLTQYNHILTQFVENPDQPILDSTLITDKSRHLLPDPSELLDDTWHGAIHSMLTMQAQQIPNKIALQDTTAEWTYQQLDDRSSQLANYLHEHYVAPQAVVAIYGHRSASLVLAVMGVLKAGAAFLILDPAYPAARLVSYLAVAKPKALLHIEAAGPLPEDVTRYLGEQTSTHNLILSLGTQPDDNAALAGYSTTAPLIDVHADDPACVGFTSGSTGQPKAVLGRHGSLTHFMPWHEQTFQLNRTDRFSMLSGLAHDPLQRDIFTSIWFGASLHIPNPDLIGQPMWLANWFREQQITVTNLTPAMLQLMADTAEPNISIESLRYAFLIGDTLTRHDVKRLRHIAPYVIPINYYGSTETQRALSFCIPDLVEETTEKSTLVTLAQQRTKEIIPLGRGIPDSQMLILNTHQNVAGIGEVGEIHVRSPHLALGYVDDVEMTQARFISNPFSNLPNDYLYKTGDLGRYLPDGQVDFAGRIDNQVSIRGYRVELGEIEAILSTYDTVKEAVVAAQTIDSGQVPHLVAYIVLDVSQQPPNIDELRSYLRNHLPQYMVPTTFIMLEALPLTPNGKVDRHTLPKPSPIGLMAEAEYVPPRNSLERQLAEMWQATLNIEQVGIYNNFFDLGGHSLLAVQLFGQIQDQFGRSLPLSTLFQAPTVEKLAAILQQDGWKPSNSAIVPIQSSGLKRPFFCVTPPTGSIVGFSGLARHLGPEQPFYGLHLEEGLKLNGNTRKKTPQQIAAQYIEEMRLVQPEGPYFIGGRCFGAYVAYEMAQQLQEQGQEVGLLALMAARPRHFERSRMHYIRRLWYHTKQGKLRHALLTSLPKILLKFRRKLGWRIARLNVKPKVSTYLANGAQESNYANGAQASEKPLNGNYQYVQQTYPGHITVFQTSKVTHDAWAELALGGIDFHVIPGTHLDIFHEPNVQNLAHKLGACLNEAEDEIENLVNGPKIQPLSQKKVS